MAVVHSLMLPQGTTLVFSAIRTRAKVKSFRRLAHTQSERIHPFNVLFYVERWMLHCLDTACWQCNLRGTRHSIANLDDLGVNVGWQLGVAEVAGRSQVVLVSHCTHKLVMRIDCFRRLLTNTIEARKAA